MTILTVIRGDVLAPVSVARPAGEDLSVTPEWAAIRRTRPNNWDPGNKREWERCEPGAASWALLRDLTTEALATRSKDLRLAVWLLEASIKLEGFAGARDGLRVIRELLVGFWDRGLHPLIEDGDLESRSGPLEWLNEKLGDNLREIPLTLRPEPGVNYSLRYFRESRRPSGMITAQEFDAAAAAGSPAHYQVLRDDFDGAWSELLQLEEVCAGLFPPDGLSMVDTKEAFDECRRVLDGIARSKLSVPVTSALPENGHAQKLHAAMPGIGLPEHPANGGDSGNAWAAAERLARGGDIDRALAQMTGLANIEPNGRVRFHRKLVLAEICLSTKRMRLGQAILEELAELIDKHTLDQWESTELVSAVWTRLYRCYAGESGATGDPGRADKLFERLCRLNPWQALACGDGK